MAPLSLLLVLIGTGARPASARPRSTDSGLVAAIAAQGSNSQIWSFALDGSGGRRLTSGAQHYSPSVSPHHRYILYTEQDGARLGIFRIDIDGGAPKRMTPLSQSAATAGWSPDGAHIAYAGTAPDSNRYQIFSMNANSTHKIQLTHETRASDGSPVYSPDGTKIAYTATQSVTMKGTHGQTIVAPRSEIWLMNSDGSNAQRATDGTTDGYPAWLDDTSILFARTGSNGATSQIFEETLGHSAMLVSPNDRFFTAPSPSSDLAKYAAIGLSGTTLGAYWVSLTPGFPVMPININIGNPIDVTSISVVTTPALATNGAPGGKKNRNSSSPAGWIFAGIIAAVALGVLAFLLFGRREKSSRRRCPPEELERRQLALEAAQRRLTVVEETVARVTSEGLTPAQAERERAQEGVATASAALATIEAEWSEVPGVGPSSEERAAAQARLQQARLHESQARQRLSAVEDILKGLQHSLNDAESARAVAAAAYEECGGHAGPPPSSSRTREEAAPATHDRDTTWRCPPEEVERRKRALADAIGLQESIATTMQKISLEEATPASNECDRARDALADAQLGLERIDSSWSDVPGVGPTSEERAGAQGALQEAQRRLTEAEARRDAIHRRIDELGKRLIDASARRAEAARALAECEAVDDTGASLPGTGTPRRSRVPKKTTPRHRCPPEEIARLERALDEAIRRQELVDELIRQVGAEFHASNEAVTDARAVLDDARTGAGGSVASAKEQFTAALDRNNSIDNIINILGREMMDASAQRAAAQEELDECMEAERA